MPKIPFSIQFISVGWIVSVLISYDTSACGEKILKSKPLTLPSPLRGEGKIFRSSMLPPLCQRGAGGDFIVSFLYLSQTISKKAKSPSPPFLKGERFGQAFSPTESILFMPYTGEGSAAKKSMAGKGLSTTALA